MRNEASLGRWPRCPEAAQWFANQYETFADANPTLRELEQRFLDVAGVDIRAVIDHWVLPDSPETRQELGTCELVLSPVPGEENDWPVYEHRQARFPRVRLAPPETPGRIALAAEEAVTFFVQNGLEPKETHGRIDSSYQECCLPLPQGEFAVVSRSGYQGFRPDVTPDDVLMLRLDDFRYRLWNRRQGGNDVDNMAATTTLVKELIAAFGQARATDEFFAAERRVYLARNRAAQWQYERQNEIGIGWANHDHHTYRSSRENFRALMQLFLTLGFVMRERFYAGAEAGWGAQILEHPVSRVVIFADVDMAPDELDIDFANQDLPPRDTLGTIGLWCALHGDSIGSAGMHHLEAEFDYERARANLEANGYPVMAPFTDLPMLKQAFTFPEIWPVSPERLDDLLEHEQITPEQAERFRTQGAPGSHLEILQRWDGFKGFNKTGVSVQWCSGSNVPSPTMHSTHMHFYQQPSVFR